MATSGNKRNFKAPLSTEARLLESKTIGLGTLTHPDTARLKARVILFARMGVLLPADLKKLKDAAVPLYKKLHELGRRISPMSQGNVPALIIREKLSDGAEDVRAHNVESWSTLSQAADYFDEAKILAATILRWADQIHMGTEWFLDAVLKNVMGWSWQRGGEELTWLYPSTYMELEHGNKLLGGNLPVTYGWGTLDRVVPVPTIKPYNPSSQTRENHLSDVTAELKRYYRDQERHFETAGFSRATSKRKRAGVSRWAHFDWFIDYQMKGCKQEAVGRGPGGDKLGGSAISRALGEMSDLLQVTLRSRT